jgi:hypothetical protein
MTDLITLICEGCGKEHEIAKKLADGSYIIPYCVKCEMFAARIIEDEYSTTT